MKMKEGRKLVELNPPFESIEFSPVELAKVSLMFVWGLDALLKGVPESRRYQIDLKMFEVKRVRK